MGITIAPLPSIGELIAQWGLYLENTTSGFRMSRSFPDFQGPGTGSATGTVYSTEIFGGGIGLAAGMVAVPGASANIRPEVDLHAGFNLDSVPEFIPWCQLVSTPVLPGLPDFLYTVQSYHFARLTVASASSPLVTGLAWCTAGGPGWGLGAGNPGDVPQNPSLGFFLDRNSLNWFARLYPGQGFWTPTVDIDTGVPAAAWHQLGLTVARVGGNAVIRWQIDGTQVAEYRPVAPVSLYSFVDRWGTAPSVNGFRASGGSDDGLEHYVGGPGPTRIYLQS